MRVLVYIENQLMDVSEDTIIALTFQMANLGNITQHKANYSNEFKLPKTSNNKKVLGHLDNENSQTSKPYEKLSAKIVQNGLEVISNGLAAVTSSDDYFNVTIYSGIYDLFTSIGDKRINDLDYSAYKSATVPWGKTKADTWRNTSTGIVFPVIQYGVNLRDVAGQKHGTYDDVAGAYYLPCFYYHTILDKIISEAGFTKDGNVFSNVRFTRLIVPAGNKTDPSKYTEKFYKDRSFEAGDATSQSMVNPTSPVKVTFANVAHNGDKNYYNGIDTYNPAGDYHFIINVYANLTLIVSGGTVDVQIYSGGTPVSGGQLNVGSGTYTLTESSTISSGADFARSIQIKTNTGTPSVTVTTRSFKITAVKSTDTRIFHYNEVLPEIKQKDFIKDFLVRFGQMAFQSGKKITFKSLEDIITDRAGAKDWTGKRDAGMTQEISFLNATYGRTNNFLYQQLDTTTNEFTGAGKFTIPDENLPEKVDYTSIFASTHTTPIHSFNVASIAVYNDTDTPVYDTDPGTRLLYVRDGYPGEPSVIFDSLARTDYQVAYFEDGRFSSNVSYQKFLDTYYKRYISAIQKTKLITRYYFLSEMDIAQLDFFKLVYDNGNYYLLNKVVNFIPGRSTKVELLKVS